jgi:hypothetical protein
MLRRVALLGTGVPEECCGSIIRVTRIGELGTTLARYEVILLRLIVTANVVPSSPILVTLMMEALRSSDTSVLTRVTRSNILEGGILHESSYVHYLNLFYANCTLCHYCSYTVDTWPKSRDFRGDLIPYFL